MKVVNNIEILAPKGGFPEKAAEEIRKQLIAYKPPKDVVEKTGKSGIADVEEEWLILVCGPATQKDPEITRVVDEYIKAGKRDRILALLAEGHSKESFPKALYFEIRPDGTKIDREPLGANITAENEKKALKNIEVEKLRLLAPMLGVAFDDLLNRKRRQKRMVFTAILAAALFGVLVFFGFAIYKVTKINGQNKTLSSELAKAEESKRITESERDAAKESLAESAAVKAAEALAEDNTELALLIELEYLPEMQNVKALTDIFEETLKRRCAKGFVPLTTTRAYNRTHRGEQSEEEVTLFPDAREIFHIVSREKEPLAPEKEKVVEKDKLEITDYQYAQGFEDRIIALSKEGISVYNKEPFEYLYTLSDEHTTEAGCAPDGTTYWNSFFAAALPNGERRFLIGEKYVYDAKNGEFLYEIDNNGQSYGVNRGFLEISKEGWLPFRIGDSIHLMDLTDGHDIGVITDPDRTVYQLMGGKDAETDAGKESGKDAGTDAETDSVTGRTSAKLISISNEYSSCLPMLWCYNDEEIPVPDSLTERIALARELLGGRELTDKEKRDNYLE